MAINEVVFPTVPDPVSGDWAKAIELIEMAMQNINNPLQVDGSNIPQGSTFQVGGHIYYADGDTAISGTPSDYVKLTVSGTTLVPSFVANLSGVSWNKIWNGYYDSSDDYYIFDEVKAIILGTLSGGGSKFAELWNNNFDQRLKTTDTPTFTKINTGNGDVECYAMDQDTKTTDNVTFNNLTIAGLLLPTSSPERDSYVLGASEAYALPRGVWIISLVANPSTGSIFIDINIAGTWRTIAYRDTAGAGATSYGAMVFSDGTNVRVRNSWSGGTYTFYFHRY